MRLIKVFIEVEKSQRGIGRLVKIFAEAEKA